LLNRYLAPSLTKRLQGDSWYENRIIRYVLRDSIWLGDLENTFSEARLNAIPNSEDIFNVLQGTELDYDERLFDALAEVRLARWARIRGYQEIEKLKVEQSHRTPDFLMKRQGKVVLAEAKHFRTRDYLLYFVAEQLEGLALKTDGLTRFGLQVETGNKYDQERDAVLQDRDIWLERTRCELTETLLFLLEQYLGCNENAAIEILGGLFEVKRSKTIRVGRVSSTLAGMLSPRETVMLCLSKLQGELMGKLKQIKDFMNTKQIRATRAIVFFSGVDEWEPEWAEVWSTLNDNGEQWAWDCVASIKAAADALINIPFDLIVGRYKQKNKKGGVVRYGSVEYVSFPWKPEDLQP
jgi:hypothetical protein